MSKHYMLRFSIFVFLLVFSFQMKGQYCLPVYSQYCQSATSTDYVNDFSTTGGVTNIVNNSSGCNGVAPNNYFYFNAMTVSQVQGLSFNVSMQCGPTFGQGFRIWVDYNNDQDFADPGEDVYASAGSVLGTVYTGTIAIPLATVPGVKRMRVMCRWATVPAITDYCSTGLSYGECEDYNLNVIAATPCNQIGLPPLTAGTATATPANPCPGVNVVASLTGSSLLGGLAYQWYQSAACGTQPWSPISGTINPSALTPTLIVSAVASTQISYRCVITCTGNGDTSWSAPSNCVVVQPWSCNTPCYGISSAQNAADQDIFNMTVGSLNNTTDCINPLIGSQGTSSGTGTAASMYANFSTGVPAPNVYKGLSTPFSLTIGTCGGFNVATSAKIYIDFNHNAVFTDAGEEVFSTTNINSLPSTVVTGNFTAPLSSLAGCTKMRVIIMTTGAGTIAPVGTYGFGETEDYSINIITPSPSDPAISAINVPTGTCFTNNETITATLCNYGSVNIDLSVNPVTVSLNVIGTTSTSTYTVVANSGILTPYGAFCVPVTFNGVNMYPGGSYAINTSITSTLPNINIVNDSLTSAVLRSNYRPIGGPDYNVCQGSIIPFGQGLSVSGCATPIHDSVEITFTLDPSQPPICTSTGTVPTGACQFASAILPTLPAGSTINSPAILTVTNLASASLGCINCTWPSEMRFSLFQGAAPPGATSTFYPGVVGNNATTGSNAQGYTYTNTIDSTIIGTIYSVLGAGGTIKIGNWKTYNPIGIAPHVINYGGNPTVAKLKIKYTYVPASFEWYKNPTGGSILYTYSPFNPIGVTGSGLTNTNTPGTYPFYAACAGSSSCRVPVNLIINPVPTVVQDTMIGCEYALASNSAIFNLPTISGYVSAFNLSTSVSYFGDQALFLPVTNPTNDTSSTNFIYSKVTYNATGCYSSDSVYLSVNSIPEITPGSNNVICAPDTIDISSYFSVFSLSPIDTFYYADAAYTIPYPNPHAISVADSVYIIVKTNNGVVCADSNQLEINISPATDDIALQNNLTFPPFSDCNIVCNNTTLQDGNTETVSTGDCRKIATVTDAVDGVNLGVLAVCEEIDCTVQTHLGQPYLNRHYEITPTNNDSAYVCLYFLQQDFDDFNAASASLGWPDIDSAKTNLCITKVSGGDFNTPGHTAIAIPTSAITSTYDPITTIWTVCFPVSSFSYFYCHTCNYINPLNPLGSALAPLPVTILNFTGKQMDGKSVLKWTTSSEHNNSHFIVERSRDAKNYLSVSNKIPTKAIGGNSSSKLDYTFTDELPFRGHNYFRLTQFDLDGHENKSRVVDIYFGSETMVTLYPNPVNSELNIDINTPTISTTLLKISDATGKTVHTVQMQLQAGNNTTKVDLNNLANGIYMVHITNSNGLNYSQTIRKD